jgi:hypothetical protein
MCGSELLHAQVGWAAWGGVGPAAECSSNRPGCGTWVRRRWMRRDHHSRPRTDDDGGVPGLLQEPQDLSLNDVPAYQGGAAVASSGQRAPGATTGPARPSRPPWNRRPASFPTVGPPRAPAAPLIQARLVSTAACGVAFAAPRLGALATLRTGSGEKGLHLAAGYGCSGASGYSTLSILAAMPRRASCFSLWQRVACGALRPAARRRRGRLCTGLWPMATDR